MSNALSTMHTHYTKLSQQSALDDATVSFESKDARLASQQLTSLINFRNKHGATLGDAAMERRVEVLKQAFKDRYKEEGGSLHMQLHHTGVAVQVLALAYDCRNIENCSRLIADYMPRFAQAFGENDLTSFFELAAAFQKEGGPMPKNYKAPVALRDSVVGAGPKVVALVR